MDGNFEVEAVRGEGEREAEEWKSSFNSFLGVMRYLEANDYVLCSFLLFLLSFEGFSKKRNFFF